MKKAKKTLSAEEFEAKFDADEEILEDLDLNSGERINQNTKRVNIEFPQWMIDSLDKEANRLGVARQALVKIWVADRLESKDRKLAA